MIKSLKLIKKIVLKVDADIYHLHDPELLRIVKYIKKHNKKVIFDSHEDYLSTIEVKSWIPRFLRKISKKIYKNYEKRIISQLDGSIVCYHWTKERYKAFIDNVELVFNFPIVSKYKPIDINYKTNKLAYAGGITSQWNHETVLKSLELTKNEFEYLLAGTIRADYKIKLSSFSGWNKVVYKGRLKFNDVYKEIYSKASIGIALLGYIPQCNYHTGNLSNTKLFEFMLLKLPIVCTDFHLWKDIIDSEKCGICIKPKDEKSLANALDYLSENPDVAKRMGNNGYDAIVKKYNWEIDSEKLLKVYKRIEGIL